MKKLAFDTEAIAPKTFDANFWQKNEGGQFFRGCAAEWRVDPVVLIWGSAANVNPRRRRQEAKLTSTTAALNTKAQPARKYKTNTEPKKNKNETRIQTNTNITSALRCFLPNQKTALPISNKSNKFLCFTTWQSSDSTPLFSNPLVRSESYKNIHYLQWQLRWC